jgi:hypothetical protein
MYFVILLLACVLVAIVAMAMLRRSRPQHRVAPYSDIRAEIIDQLGDAHAPPPPMPVRPAGLDKRLGADVRRELESLWPPTDENWTRYFELTYKIVTSVRDELADIDSDLDWYELLSPSRRAFLVAFDCECEVNNGGFDQFFLNSSGDAAGALVESLNLIGAHEAARLAEKAVAQFPEGPARHRAIRLKQLEAIPESGRKTWGELDGEFILAKVPFGGIAANLGVRYALDHADEFFKPADPAR